MTKIYVGTYAKYNSGSINGAWLDVEDYINYEDFLATCQEIHSDEEDPEFMFQDIDELPSNFYSESAMDPRLWDWADLSEEEKEIWSAWVVVNEDRGEAIADMVAQAYEHLVYMGEWEDYVREVVAVLVDENSPLANYIDLTAFGRDLSYDYVVEGQFVFAI